MTSDEDMWSFVLGLCVGVILGSALAVLFAPASGSASRRRLRERVAALRSRVRDQAEAMAERGRSAVDGALGSDT